MEWNDQMMDEELRRQAASLEKEYPAAFHSSSEIWDAIGRKRKQQYAMPVRRIWTVAAAALLFALVVPVWYYWKIADKPVVTAVPPVATTYSAEEDAIGYIYHLCAGNNIVCQSPAFIELKTELESSASALSAVDEQISVFGGNDQLLQAKTRIENHQAKVIRAMLKIL